MPRIACVILLTITTISNGNSQKLGIEPPAFALTLNKGFDFVCSFLINETPHLFCSDSQTGKAALWNMSLGNANILNMTIGMGWDYFNVIQCGKNLNYLIVNSATGEIRVMKDIMALSSCCSPADRIELSFKEKWTFSNIISLNGDEFLLRYSKTNGDTFLNKISITNGINESETIHVKLEKGWDDIRFVETDNHFFLLKFSKAKSAILVEDLTKIEGDSTGEVFSKMYENRRVIEQLPRFYSTHNELFRIGEKIFLFLYNASTGNLEIHAQKGNVTTWECMYKTKWSAGWSNFKVLYINGMPYLFHHKESSGLARISKITFN